jgi:hypothetical protein
MGISCSSWPSWLRLSHQIFSSLELDLVCLGAPRSIVRQTSGGMVHLAHKRWYGAPVLRAPQKNVGAKGEGGRCGGAGMHRPRLLRSSRAPPQNTTAPPTPCAAWEGAWRLADPPPTPPTPPPPWPARLLFGHRSQGKQVAKEPGRHRGPSKQTSLAKPHKKS